MIEYEEKKEKIDKMIMNQKHDDYLAIFLLIEALKRDEAQKKALYDDTKEEYRLSWMAD